MLFFNYFGAYLILLRRSFKKPEKWSVYRKEFFTQMFRIGLGSLSIVSVVAIFMGAVFTVQTSYQLVSSLIPNSVIGSIISDSTILELAPTITAIVLAGKIGSNIASEIGTMRVTEQIDAIEIMGINSAGFLVMPRVLASIIAIPLLNIYAMTLCILSGIVVGQLSGILSPAEFMDGARETFIPFNISFSMIKSFVFAFIISSVASYQGYTVKGGSREVGFASTSAVVVSCNGILLADYLLTQLLLT